MATFTHNGTEWTIEAESEGQTLTLRAASGYGPGEFFTCPASDVEQYPDTILQMAAGSLFALLGIDPDAAPQSLWGEAETTIREAMASRSEA